MIITDLASLTSRRPRTSSPTSTGRRRRSRSRRGSWSRAATSRATSASSGASASEQTAAVRQHHQHDLPALDHPERAGTPSSRICRPTSGPWATGAGHRHRRPGLRGQPAGVGASTPRSASPWATSWATSTSTRPSPRSRRQGRGRMLSTPKVTTQNNQAGRDQAGRPDPLSRPSANNTVTVQFKDAVLTLKVTPQITEAGTVILNLEVENDTRRLLANLVNGHPARSTPSRPRPSCSCRDGATAVIGGIYQSNEQTLSSRRRSWEASRSSATCSATASSRSENNELLLFITPRIVKG